MIQDSEKRAVVQGEMADSLVVSLAGALLIPLLARETGRLVEGRLSIDLLTVAVGYVFWMGAFLMGQAVLGWWTSERASRANGAGLIAALPYLLYLVLTIAFDPSRNLGRFFAFPASGLGSAFAFGVAQEYPRPRWFAPLVAVGIALFLFFYFRGYHWEFRWFIM